MRIEWGLEHLQVGKHTDTCFAQPHVPDSLPDSYPDLYLVSFPGPRRHERSILGM